MNWYVKVLKQYVDFSGRARRTEYWMFTLVNAIVVILLELVDTALGTGGFHVYPVADGATAIAQPGVFSGLYLLAVFLPSLAVAVRRLHDTDRSGWWIFIGLVPIIGWIVLLVFYVLPGTLGANRRGPDPKAALAHPAY